MAENEKFDKLVHYICEKTKNEPSKLGATKLNKVLWYSEVFAFIEQGKSISGEKFIKRQFGPVPKNILASLEKLSEEEKITVRHESFHGYTQKQFISLVEADDSFMSQQEQNIVNDVIDVICEDHTATSISELSHDDLWKMAEEGEEIPLQAIFSYTPGSIKETDIAWATKRVAA